MPLPGPSFLKLAQLLAGNNVELVDEYLQYVYTAALYQDWYTMDIPVKGGYKFARFIPGHVWLSDRADGPRNPCKVMLIGKMPGMEDVREKRNWVSKAGDVLIGALERLDTFADTYGDWYVTNLMKFAHPNPTQGSAIAPAWLRDCRPLLAMELQLIRPDYILCLGSEASKEVLGSSGSVNNSVGKVFDYKIKMYDGTEHATKVMTCIHPAAVARAPDLQPQLDSSLRMFLKLVKGENVGAVETDLEHIVVDSEETAIPVLERIIQETANGAAIAVDCEWHGEYPQEPGSWLRTIQLSHKAKFALCIVLRACGGVKKLAKSEKVKELLHKVFENRSDRHIRAVGHFHRADLPWLLHYGLDIRKQFEAPADPNEGAFLTKKYGGFDTGTAAHAVCETDDYKLEVLATRLVGCPRYDTALQEAKRDVCKAMKLSMDSLGGYGYIPDGILNPYALYDVDVTRRLFDVYNGIGDEPGLLDFDEFGNNSRTAFWISMRASPACLEMELTGIKADKTRAEEMLMTYTTAKAAKLIKLREKIGWSTFNIDSPFDVRELLYGPKYRGQIDKVTGEIKRNGPLTTRYCNLAPIKSTGKVKRTWAQLEATGEAKNYSPSTDRESLGILFNSAQNKDDKEVLSLVRDIKFLSQLLKTVLRPPDKDKDGQYETDEGGNLLFEDGLLSYICSDGRIRTHVFQTLETGRFSSSRPNLTNISKRREADYSRILGDQYKYPLRSILVASPGCALVEADYLGAELAAMAWLSGDKTMTEHVRRAQLPEDHPDYYDIHSAVAVAAFRLNCAPTKAGLASIGMKHIRVAAKNVMFGYAYGRGAEAIALQCKEEGIDITIAEAQALIDGLVARYSALPVFFGSCRKRVHEERWICNCLGRFRRFRQAPDFKTAGEQERQAMNFTAQSLVADAVSRALDHLYTRREFYGLNYKILLQIHDALLLEVPISEIDAVYNTVLPECMTDLVDIWPADLNGYRLPCEKPYHLGIDRTVEISWGSKLTKSDCYKYGIPDKYGK
jgi:uracil-DNA glycosylase family 4